MKKISTGRSAIYANLIFRIHETIDLNIYLIIIIKEFNILFQISLGFCYFSLILYFSYKKIEFSYILLYFFPHFRRISYIFKKIIWSAYIWALFRLYSFYQLENSIRNLARVLSAHSTVCVPLRLN